VLVHPPVVRLRSMARVSRPSRTRDLSCLRRRNPGWLFRTRASRRGQRRDCLFRYLAERYRDGTRRRPSRRSDLAGVGHGSRAGLGPHLHTRPPAGAPELPGSWVHSVPDRREDRGPSRPSPGAMAWSIRPELIAAMPNHAMPRSRAWTGRHQASAGGRGPLIATVARTRRTFPEERHAS